MCITLSVNDFIFIYPEVRIISMHYGSFIYLFLKKHHTVFQNDCTNLHSHQHYIRVHFSPYSCQHCGFHLYFPSNKHSQAFFDVHVSHLTYPLWKVVYSDHLPIFNWVVWVVFVAWVFYIPWILKPITYMMYK